MPLRIGPFTPILVTLFPLLLDRVPVTVTEAFIPRPHPIPFPLTDPAAPCQGSVGTGSSTDLL